MYSMTNIVNIAVKLYMKIVERQTSFTLVKKEKELLFVNLYEMMFTKLNVVINSWSM